MFSRLLIAAFAVAAFTGVAHAQFNVRALPAPLPERLVPVPIGPEHAGGCDEIYLNETTQTGYYTLLLDGGELADDLHTTATSDWPLCAFDFGYYKPTAGAVDATVTFYRNNGVDGGIGAVMAGPFLIAGLNGGGGWAYHVEAPFGTVGPDVWMGVEFSDAGTGLLSFDPPTTGSSHDLVAADGTIYITPFAEHVANYFLGVYASRPTGTQDATWGQVKSIYR
jgi:hypothetical protein